MLETYTALDNFLLPTFLDVITEVTGNAAFSMYNLSRCIDAPLECLSIYEKLTVAGSTVSADHDDVSGTPRPSPGNAAPGRKKPRDETEKSGKSAGSRSRRPDVKVVAPKKADTSIPNNRELSAEDANKKRVALDAKIPENRQNGVVFERLRNIENRQKSAGTKEAVSKSAVRNGVIIPLKAAEKLPKRCGLGLENGKQMKSAELRSGAVL